MGKIYSFEIKPKEINYEEYKSDFGIKWTINNPLIAKKFSLKTTKGILVLEVFQNTLAEYIGINKGDVILRMNGIEINNKSDFDKAFEIVKSRRYIDIVIDRFGQKLYFRSYL
jgi:C-terminal processing protease CtpA/Prc